MRHCEHEPQRKRRIQGAEPTIHHANTNPWETPCFNPPPPTHRSVSATHNILDNPSHFIILSALLLPSQYSLSSSLSTYERTTDPPVDILCLHIIYALEVVSPNHPSIHPPILPFILLSFPFFLLTPHSSFYPLHSLFFVAPSRAISPGLLRQTCTR